VTRGAATRRLTVIVSGMIAGDPHQGGATWAVLQYVLGLADLGHDVYLVEPVRAVSLRPSGTSLEDSTAAAYFRAVVREFGLEGRAALLVPDTRRTVGLPYAELRRVASRAHVLLNVSGMLADDALVANVPTRVYLDLDPGFNQLWHATQGIDMRLDGHTHFVTVGGAIGDEDCRVPTCGRAWTKTLQPVVLAHWPVAERVVHDALTTVGNWRAYGSIDHDGVFYGQKAHSLRPLYDLPRVTGERFVLAMGIHPDERSDLEALGRHGWDLVEPVRAAGTPARYRRFIRGSKAEFGIAKSGYVAAQCGWFSDRSACYLASGRPVISQDTGFGRVLPTGDGLFAFQTAADVLGAVEALRTDYGRHAQAARRIAETYFDSRTVLRELLERAGC
jgi:hypothetical protein